MFDNFSGKILSVLELFLKEPDEEFHLREIARKLKISSSTAKLAVDELKKQDLIVEEKKANLRIFSANKSDNFFCQLKKVKNLEFLEKEKLVEKLRDENTISIVLFGSFATGTNGKKSDIDVLIITTKKSSIGLGYIGKSELQIIQKTPAEFRELEKESKPFYKEIISTGINLFGEMPI